MERGLLKFLMCGSVDDGKSTLIGHTLYAAKLVFADQKRALELDSKVGAAGGEIDYSLLLDGLEAEREQGITIDVAYRFFSTESRSFIVADSPGHEEYTRNMAVGAAFADLAVILVDATQGVLVQTRRHARICALSGIRDFVFAVNKMDLVGYSEETFERIVADIRELVSGFEVNTLKVIPVSATAGDNLTESSPNTPWYGEAPFLSYLESVDTYRHGTDGAFAMCVQRVSRPDRTFRGFQGEVFSGSVSVGDEIRVLPSGETAHVSRIIRRGVEASDASEGDPVTVCLDREVDVSRGCVLSSGSGFRVGSSFAASLLWMDREPLKPGDNLLIRIGTSRVSASVRRIVHAVDVNTGVRKPAERLEMNALALCELELGVPVVYDVFSKTPALGRFILVDRASHATAAAGTVAYPLDTDGKAISQQFSVDRGMRERMSGHKAVTVWFTGLSGAGKSTIADLIEQSLYRSGIRTFLLDGDNVRGGLCRDLGFSAEDRRENIRRVAETARLLNDAGVVVLACFVSPFREDRKTAREIIGEGFVEVHVSTSLNVCAERDVKGLYKKAMRGEIRDFTGVTSPYEIPLSPELTVDTAGETPRDSAAKVLSYVRGLL